MSLAKFVTVVEWRADRQARERKAWIEEAVEYMLSRGMFTQEFRHDAVQLAESLHSMSKDEGGETFVSAKEAVDEELTYWTE